MLDPSVRGELTTLRYKKQWMSHFDAKADMKKVIDTSECDNCKKIRTLRQRVVHANEPVPEEIKSPIFAAAPAIYSFNVPRYYTTQLRAREFGKSQSRQITWFYAKDVPLHRDDRDLGAEALQHKMEM